MYLSEIYTSKEITGQKEQNIQRRIIKHIFLYFTSDIP